MLDIVVAIATALITALTAYLGIHVTLHPAESPCSKKLYKAGFILSGAMGVALVGIQSYRNNVAQGALQSQLNRIEHNSQEPPSVQVNVPPPTVIFEQPQATVERDSGKAVSSPGRARFALSEDHARIAVTEITANPPTGLFNFPYFNIFHANLGKAPAIGFLRKVAVGTTLKELTQTESNTLQLQNSTFTKDALKELDADQRASYPNDPDKKFFSIPGSPSDATVDQITKELDNVKAAMRYLYFFITMVYRDPMMSPGTYGVTESCIFVFGDLTAWHECGTRYSLRLAKDLEVGRVSSGEP